MQAAMPIFAQIGVKLKYEASYDDAKRFWLLLSCIPFIVKYTIYSNFNLGKFVC